MDIAPLVASLSRLPGVAEVRQTHISAVFLTPEFAYKIKKPVNLGFLDFSTLDRRRHFCQEEVRLNQRLAPSVYLGVVPVTRTKSGLAFEGDGEVVEWAVKMVRLPDEATLEQHLLRNILTPDTLERLGERVAGFHASADRNEHIASFGRFDVVAGNARENFTQSEPHVGVTVTRAVFDRLRFLTESHLARLQPLIEERARRGVPCDTHGDLHLDHVYLFPDRPPPEDLVIIDCIEFNERFRYADPVADMAFLVMDLLFHGRPDLAAAFTEAYFRNAPDGRELLPFCTAYRAAVRGKVEGFKATEPEVPVADREAARVSARAHWLLALGQLEEPDLRPCLVLIGGLPGTGKSTLARMLAERASFDIIRSDIVRKELAGVAATEPGGDIYTRDWHDRTYAECLRRAESLLAEGKRVIVDASFSGEARRRTFLGTAVRMGVPGLLLLCQARTETVRQRLTSRRGDASDAGWEVYASMAGNWQPPSTETSRNTHFLFTDGPAETVCEAALGKLRAVGLVF